MIFQFLGLGRYRYSRLRNVRVNRYTFVVERKYITQIERFKGGRSRIKKMEWKTVDYKTTHLLQTGNWLCPPDYVDKLVKTAF